MAVFNPKVHYRGTLCGRCDSTIRYKSNKGCVSCVKKNSHQWQKDNPEAYAIHCQHQHNKNSEKRVRNAVKWNQDNKEKRFEHNRTYRNKKKGAA